MKKLTVEKLSTPERMLLALLRAALSCVEAEVDVFRDVTDADWKQCYRLAMQQGVKALAWDGVATLPAGLRPFYELYVTWAMAVDNYEQRYAHYCRTVHRLSALYATHGIRTVQLKGVGLSALYPVPAHREGGDIDIYTSSANPSELTDIEANRLADELIRQQGIGVKAHSYKHSNFTYQGIPVENHHCFVNVRHYAVAAQIEPLLQEVLCPQPVDLLGGECRIFTPSEAFNTLFLSYHAAQHYGSGFSLHHLCDWAVLVRRHGMHLPDAVTDPFFREFVAALTQLCNRFLGTEVAVSGGGVLADEMLHELLRPPFPHKAKVDADSKWGILWYKIRRFWHTSMLLHRIHRANPWRRFWRSLVYHLRKPYKIFGR